MKIQNSVLIGKSKVKKKTLDVIKDDRQAFEILVGEVQTLCEALEYPLTTVLLALAELYEILRQQCNAALHRLLYEK